MGVPIYTRLIYVSAIVTSFVLGEMRVSKKKPSMPSGIGFTILFLIGILSAAFNYFMQLGFQLAPNIGYINAINASSIAGVTLFSALIFKDELTKRKFIGIIGVTLGLILLVM